MRFVGAIALLMGIASAQKVKFMPLGDSITESSCWRALIWDQLSSAGLANQVDFVGSMNNNALGCSTNSANFDVDHEGHWGWLAIDIANNYLQQWLQNTKPDVVQVMLGANDCFNDRPTDTIIAAYTKMVGLMRQSNPRMKIIFDKLIPAHDKNDQITALNARIPSWAASQNTTASPIYIADCSSDAGYALSMNRDGVHPNTQGDQFIAGKVGPLVARAIRDVIAGQ